MRSTSRLRIGSILFLIYVNDLQYFMPNACLRLFADDNALVVNNSNTDTLITDVKDKLKMVHEYCTCNKLTCDKLCFVSNEKQDCPPKFHGNCDGSNGYSDNLFC